MMGVKRFYYEDVSLSEKDIWQKYRQYINNDNIAEARELTKDLQGALLNGDSLNVLSQKLTSLQQGAGDWSKTKIKVSAEPPQDLQAGEVFLKIIEVI